MKIATCGLVIFVLANGKYAEIRISLIFQILHYANVRWNFWYFKKWDNIIILWEYTSISLCYSLNYFYRGVGETFPAAASRPPNPQVYDPALRGSSYSGWQPLHSPLLALHGVPANSRRLPFLWRGFGDHEMGVDSGSLPWPPEVRGKRVSQGSC